MYQIINKKVSFSGNSAHYSRAELEKLSPKFNWLRLVEFREDSTVSIYHYGKIGKKEIEELDLLGKILVEPLIIFGYNYSDDRPLVIVISNGKAFFANATIEINNTHHVITSSVEDLPYIKTYWSNHSHKRYENQPHLPKLLSILEPDCDFDFNDE